MATIENTPQRLVLRSGSTTLTLDGEMGKVSMQRKMLFWNRAPIEKTLAEIVDATVDTAVDRSSGVEVCNTILVSLARVKSLTRERRCAADLSAGRRCAHVPRNRAVPARARFRRNKRRRRRGSRSATGTFPGRAPAACIRGRYE